MNREKLTSWFPFLRQSRHSQEPSAALFQGLRINLTLWYCGILAAALIIFCVALYVGASILLLNPVENSAIANAHRHVGMWVNVSPLTACSPNNLQGPDGGPGGPDYRMPEMIACYNQNGTLQNSTLQSDSTTAKLYSAFLSNTLAKSALQNGQPVSDTVNVGGVGLIYRYALPVQNSNGNGYIGVVVAGSNIDQQESALSTLLALLIGVGSVSLLGAAFGGLFLASRALAPARLAFTRQQRFIADASHELRTPLTLMRADAEVLLRGRQHMAEDDVVLLEDIVAEANHMSTLANSMLSLARLDANAQHREHEVVSLDVLAQQGIQRVSAFAEQKGVAVKQEKTGDAFVIGDPMLLEQALLVVLDNAIKYNRPDGQVTVRTAVQNGRAQLEVHDTGIGIANEHLPHLGERFYRVDKARSREAGGTGLGLSIAQHVASLHDGTLTLSSVPNEGTTVTISLPLVQGKQVRQEETNPVQVMQ